MAQAAVGIDGNEGGTAIDRAHLKRMTFGDRALEREVLQLFERQAAVLIERMRSGDAAAIATLAHTLKGSALGIGAGGVAQAARAVEAAATPENTSLAIDRLAEAITAARASIAALLRA